MADNLSATSVLTPLSTLLLLATDAAVNTTDLDQLSNVSLHHYPTATSISAKDHLDYEMTLTKAIPMTFVYAVIFVTGIVGNVCTCVVISRNKYMHTATNYYLFSLAVSDLLLLVLGLPQEMYALWVPKPYIFGETACVIRGLAAECSTNASILTITSFTIERYLAICHPFLSHTMSKLSRAVKLILIVWLLAALCAIPQAIQFGIIHSLKPDGTIIPETADCMLKNPLSHSFELATIFFFLLPMSLITVLYVLIGLRLRKAEFRTPTTSTKSHNGSYHEPRRNGSTNSRGSAKEHNHQSVSRSGSRYKGTHASTNSRRAVVKMLVAVVVAFFFCWAPFHAQRLMAIYASSDSPLAISVFEALTYVSGVLYYVSATINPILYHIMSLKFRTAFKDTLGSCCGKRTSRTHKFSSVYNFNSTMRSRVLTDNMETTLETLLREEDAEEGCANGKRTSPSNGGATSASSTKRSSIRSATAAGNNNTGKFRPVSDRSCSSRPCGSPGGAGVSCSVGFVKSDSISNSSMQMLDDETVNPAELSNFMAELNERYDSAKSGSTGKLNTVVVVVVAAPQENGNKDNGYCISSC